MQHEMSLNPGTIQVEGPPSTTPFFQHLSTPPPVLVGGLPHHHPPSPHRPLTPRGSRTYYPNDYNSNAFAGSHAGSPLFGAGGDGMGDVNRNPSHSSRSPRAATPASRSPRATTPAPRPSVADEHKGFREIGDYMSRDGDCILLRRFGILRFRDVLCKQAQVEETERHLEEADNAALSGGGDVEMVKELMKELDVRLKAYDDALDRCRSAYTMPPPSTHSLNQAKGWLRTRGFEWYLPKDQEDVITFDQQLVTDGLITRFTTLIARRIFKNEVSRKAGVAQLPSYRAVFVSRALISFIAPVILLVPVVALCYLKKLWQQIIVVAVATIMSSFVMMIAKAGGAEVFMATSAYAAVMVVFLGAVANVGNGGGSGPGKGN